MSKSQFNDNTELYLKKKAIDIIDTYYQIEHCFVFDIDYRGYDASYGLDFICAKCKYVIEVTFYDENDWQNKDNLRFLTEDYILNPHIDCTRLSYFGESRILNNDKVEIVNCNEWIIKKLLE